MMGLQYRIQSFKRLEILKKRNFINRSEYPDIGNRLVFTIILAEFDGKLWHQSMGSLVHDATRILTQLLFVGYAREGFHARVRSLPSRNFMMLSSWVAYLSDAAKPRTKAAGAHFSSPK
jgi:hypothetical protein